MKQLPAIIIARGGSKRIPRKNVKPFCGKTLVDWSIIQARASECCFPVVLSTDDDEIASIGNKYDIEVLRRPVMPDNTTGAVAYDIAIDQLRDKGYKFDAFISLLATGPLRLPWDLNIAIHMYWEFAYPVKTQLISGVEVAAAFHLEHAKNDYIRYNYWSIEDIEKAVIDTGLFSICDVDSYRAVLQKVNEDSEHLKDIRNRVKKIHPWSVFYICKPWQWNDIDYPEDFELSEILFKHYILDKGYYQ